MKRLILAATFLPGIALAQPATNRMDTAPSYTAPARQPAQAAPASKLPDTIVIPTKYLLRLEAILTDRHIAEVLPLYQADFVPLLQMLDDCAKIQIPDANGAIVSHGECPEVAAALQGPSPTAKPPETPTKP